MAKTLTLVESNSASIDTLAVTIKALHVNNKQMTLAVFRQLPRGETWPDCAYWGWVNYTIADEGSRWFVFSHDGRLFRRKVRDRVEFRQNTVRDVAHARDRALQSRPEPDSKYGWSRMGSILDYETGTSVRVDMAGWNAAVREWQQKMIDAAADDEATNRVEDERAATDRQLLAALPQLFIAV